METILKIKEKIINKGVHGRQCSAIILHPITFNKLSNEVINMLLSEESGVIYFLSLYSEISRTPIKFNGIPIYRSFDINEDEVIVL